MIKQSPSEHSVQIGVFNLNEFNKKKILKMGRSDPNYRMSPDPLVFFSTYTRTQISADTI